MTSDCFVAFSKIFSLSKASNTPKAAAHEKGDAPKVLPIPASCIESMISDFPKTAASGNPPAIPLARVTISGTTLTVSAPTISQPPLAPTLIFLIPVCFVIGYYSIELIEMSWKIKEVSTEAGGLNYVYLQKTLIILFPMTLLLTYLYQLLSGKWK